MVSYIEILININMLFFSFSLVQIFLKLNNEPYLLDGRIYFLNNIFNKNNLLLRKGEKKEEIWVNIGFFTIIILFTTFMISYFTIFYQFVIENFDNRFWYVFRLICTPFVFLILPNFLPKILKNFLFGYFPKNTDDYDRKKIKINKINFILNWLYIVGILSILTLFITWESSIIWLSFLIIWLILLFIIYKLLYSRKSKIF